MSVEKVNKPKVRPIARVICKGSSCNANEKVILEGVTDCKTAAEMIGDESSACTHGCLGFGSCAEACPFDAIEIIDMVAVVNKDKCKGCKLCVKACPRDVIAMIPPTQEVVVDCNSKDSGKVARQKCKVSCIGCQMCVKACPFWAMDFSNNLASIDYDKCTNCMVCATKCPTKAITANLEERKIAVISEDKCIGCTICERSCQVVAIEGFREEVHKVNESLCIGCSVCANKCPMDAIEMKVKIQA